MHIEIIQPAAPHEGSIWKSGVCIDLEGTRRRGGVGYQVCHAAL